MNPRDGRLSDEQIESFHREGYLIVEDLFEAEELTPLRKEIASGIGEKIEELLSEGSLDNTYANDSFETRLVKIFRDSEEIGRKIMGHLEGVGGGGYQGSEMFNLIRHPKMLKIAESILGPELVSSAIYRLRTKIPGDKLKEVPWHQDSGYFASHCDSHLILTCWIPLVDVSRQNGCLEVIPRSHRSGIVKHYECGDRPGFLLIKDEDLPESGKPVVAVEIKAGSVLLLTNLTAHCSVPNQTDSIRWSVDLRYQSASTPNNVDLWPEENKAHYEKNLHTACSPPEADFVVQSLLHPDRVVDFQGFLQRRRAFYNHGYPKEKRWQSEVVG